MQVNTDKNGQTKANMGECELIQANTGKYRQIQSNKGKYRQVPAYGCCVQLIWLLSYRALKFHGHTANA